MSFPRPIIAVAVASLSLCATARADSTVCEPNPLASDHTAQPPIQRRWYGWETLAIDGVALSVLIATGVAESNAYKPWDTYAALVYPGLAAYTLGPPIVHAARGHWGKAGASFALRAGSLLVVTGAVVVSLQDDPGCESSSTSSGCGGTNPLLYLGALAIPAAVAIDAAVVANEDVPPREVAQWHWSPWLDARARAGGMALQVALR